MLETEKQTNKLHKALNQGYNIKALQDEAEAYCEKYNKDLRVYLLGLKLAENSGSQKEFLDEFYNCISKIDDYKNIWSSYTIQQLGNKDFGVIQYAKGFNKIEKSIQDVINLLEQYGDDIPEDKAKSVRSAARSTWSAWSATESAVGSAAESAAWASWSAVASAVESARSAAGSAAELAAESATESTWSAWSATESAVGSATESAAWASWSATESIRSAWSAAKSARSARSAAELATESAKSAARSAAWKNMGNCYMEILKGRIK